MVSWLLEVTLTYGVDDSPSIRELMRLIQVELPPLAIYIYAVRTVCLKSPRCNETIYVKPNINFQGTGR